MRLEAQCPVPDFDEAKHIYRIGERRIPGVSEILKTIGIVKDFSGVDPFYRERGIACHRAIELYINGDLDEETLDPVCAPYLDGFKKWWTQQGVIASTPLATEARLYSQKFGFSGTIDLILGNTIIDYKCSKSPDPASELQGLMYQWLAHENYDELMPFGVLQLPGDGTFVPIPGTINYQWDLLDGIIDLYKWKRSKHVPRMSVGR